MGAKPLTRLGAILLGLAWLSASACGSTRPGPPEAVVGDTPAVIEVAFDVDAKADPRAKADCLGRGYSFLGQNYLVEARIRLKDGSVRRLPSAGVYHEAVVDDVVREKRSYYAPTGTRRLIFTVKLQKRYSSGLTGGRITFRSCFLTLTKKVVDKNFAASQVYQVRVTNKPDRPGRR